MTDWNPRANDVFLHAVEIEPGAKRRDFLDVECAGDDLLALHDALDRLEQKDRRKAALVKLRFFAGLTNEQAAAALGISASTADNDWAYARCWLRVDMTRGAGPEPA